MNATNRPIDILLDTQSVKNSPPPTKDLGVTDSNVREKTFESVMSEQQEEASASDRRESETRETGDSSVEEKPVSQSSSAERQESKPESKQSGNEVVEDGNALPPQQRENSEAPELKLDAQLEAIVLGTESAEALGDNTEVVVGTDKAVSVRPQPETMIQAPPDLKTEAIPLPGGNTGDIEKVVAAGEPKTFVNVKTTVNTDANDLQPVSEQVQMKSPVLTREGMPTTDVKTQVKTASVSSTDNKELVRAFNSNGELKPVLNDQIQREAAKIFNPTGEIRLERSELNKNGSIRAFNPNGELKLELTDHSPKRQMTLGQELKQWLGDTLPSRESSVQTISPSPSPSPATETTTNAVNPLTRLNGLTQAMQNIPGQGAGMVSMTVAPPVNSPGWGQVVAQRIAWMVGNGVNLAELQLNPKALGPVEVSISVSNEQANVNFVSQHAGVREALELSVQRLRDMLESNGLNLADVNVSDQSLAEQREFAADQSDADSGLGGENKGEGDDEANHVRVTESSSLVDYYA